MANTLILNQSQVWNGLGTLTYTVTTAGTYNVKVQTTFPAWATEGSFGGSNQGLGSGAGGGGTGFVLGGQGPGNGGVGQSIGAGSGYPQPPSYGSNQTTNPGAQSGLSIVVNQNSSPIYTATTPAIVQSALQFLYAFQAAASDVITVVFSSSTATDKTLNGVQSNISIGQGFT